MNTIKEFKSSAQAERDRIDLQIKKEESIRRAAEYMAECSRKVSDICESAKSLFSAYQNGIITANELKNAMADVLA